MTQNIRWYNFFIFPMRILFIISIPYESNPLMKTFAKYFIVILSYILIYVGILNMEESIIIYAIIISLIILTLIVMIFAQDYSYNILVVIVMITSLSYVKILTRIMLDCFLFFSFIIGFGKIFLSVVLIPLINGAGDFFSLTALAGNGFEILAFMALFPSMIFDICLSLPLNILLTGC